jgi:hypothetical protein
MAAGSQYNGARTDYGPGRCTATGPASGLTRLVRPGLRRGLDDLAVLERLAVELLHRRKRDLRERLPGFLPLMQGGQPFTVERVLAELVERLVRFVRVVEREYFACAGVAFLAPSCRWLTRTVMLFLRVVRWMVRVAVPDGEA